MNLEYFPHFIRKNYPALRNEQNELLLELGAEFKKYLEVVFKENMDKLAPIWNIDARDVIMNQVNKTPFMMNGYHSALIIHFGNFIDKMKREAEEEIKNENL